jgi:uncharacterized protein YjbI with pentapeptide repeats
MAELPVLAAPLISQLEPCELPDGGELDELALSEALVERHGHGVLTARRIHVQESELRGVTLGEGVATELLLSDARLIGCDLSNIRARRGAIRRVELTDSRLVGFRLSEGRVEDLRVAGGTMMLCSFAHSTLRRVAFENVNLREAATGVGELHRVRSHRRGLSRGAVEGVRDSRKLARRRRRRRVAARADDALGRSRGVCWGACGGVGDWG